jgi:hypothetical protein
MAAGVHRPLKIIAFNANGIMRQSYELSKSCKAYIQMWFCFQRHISIPMRGSLFPIITFIGLTASQDEEAALSLH